MKSIPGLFLFGLMIFSSMQAGAEELQKYKAVAFALSQESEGIGFDDLSFASGIRKVLVPGGRTGDLFLIDPDTHKVTSIGGFSQTSTFHGGHSDSITSADEGDGFLFTADRTTKTVFVIDPAADKIINSAKIEGGADYVRYVPLTHELWITQPHEQRIEIFSFDLKKTALSPVGFISIPGGPESLVISKLKPLAYTHLWHGKTVLIDVKSRTITAQWANGCEGSRGIALDDQKGFLLIGCSEGAGIVIDAKIGSILSKQTTGSGVDIIGYNQKLSRLYIPSSKDGFLNIFQVSDKGDILLLKKVETVFGSQGAVADDNRGVWVGDPDHGQLLFYKDDTA